MISHNSVHDQFVKEAEDIGENMCAAKSAFVEHQS